MNENSPSLSRDPLPTGLVAHKPRSVLSNPRSAREAVASGIRYRRWTLEEDTALAKMYNEGVLIKIIAANMSRSYHSITNRIILLGLRRKPVHAGRGKIGSYSLNPHTKDKLQRLAHSRGISISSLVREIIESYLRLEGL